VPTTTRSRRLLTGGAIVVLAALAIVLGVLLVRDDDGGGGHPAATATTASQAQEMEKLRVEALQAASAFFPAQDQAFARQDFGLLRPLMVANNPLAKTLETQIADQKARGEIHDTRSRTENPVVVQLDQAKAQIRLMNIVTGGSIRDAVTGKVKQQFQGGQREWRVYLKRTDSTWLIEGLYPEDKLNAGESG
jgi:hypothetical protein